MSYRDKSAVVNNANSINAIFRPMHARGPMENYGKELVHLNRIHTGMK